jgi:hypothetical protein
MTKIQNSKQMFSANDARPPATGKQRKLNQWGTRTVCQWSLDIEIWDLFVIWCLEFGILMVYINLTLGTISSK